MKTIKIYCKICGCKLTEELIEIPVSSLSWVYVTPLMQKNKYVLCKSKRTLQNNVLVANDQYYLKDHSDESRFNGCCGSNGFRGLNKICENGHEVATEITDCGTAHYTEFDLMKVIIKENKLIN